MAASPRLQGPKAKTRSMQSGASSFRSTSAPDNRTPNAPAKRAAPAQRTSLQVQTQKEVSKVKAGLGLGVVRSKRPDGEARAVERKVAAVGGLALGGGVKRGHRGGECSRSAPRRCCGGRDGRYRPRHGARCDQGAGGAETRVLKLDNKGARGAQSGLNCGRVFKVQFWFCWSPWRGNLGCKLNIGNRYRMSGRKTCEQYGCYTEADNAGR